MDLLLSVIVIMVAMVTVIECQVAHMSQPPNPQHGAPGGRPPLHDKKHVQNKDHIMEHYDGVLDQDQGLSDDELNFHYFKVHDYDQNNRLDGIELVSALTHFHTKEGEEPEAPRMPDGELTNMIDLILEQDDTNQDGYIDYPEFIMSQSR